MWFGQKYQEWLHRKSEDELRSRERDRVSQKWHHGKKLLGKIAFFSFSRLNLSAIT
jgi:hypothetical protein